MKNININWSLLRSTDFYWLSPNLPDIINHQIRFPDFVPPRMSKKNELSGGDFWKIYAIQGAVPINPILFKHAYTIILLK